MANQSAKILGIFTFVANKILLLALVALFWTQVWIAYGKLVKQSVAYDQDIISDVEQLYPSFTLCPKYAYVVPYKYVEHGLDAIFKVEKVVFNELDQFTHIVKSEQG